MTAPMTRTVHLRREVPITLTESGNGPSALILHGGGGPATMQSIGAHLSSTMHVMTPTHPGWNGTERPAWLTTVADLALAYLQLLKEQGQRDVVVVGSSMGGWIACEMALHDDDHLLKGLILINAVGVEVEGHPIRNFFGLDARGIAEYSYHNPDRFYVDPATIPPEQVARQRANIATMRVFSGDTMNDPKLLNRLAQIQIPTLVLWGDSDRIVTPRYGRAIANAIPNAHFAFVRDAGHLPHIEAPQATFEALDAFLAQRSS